MYIISVPYSVHSELASKPNTMRNKLKTVSSVRDGTTSSVVSVLLRVSDVTNNDDSNVTCTLNDVSCWLLYFTLTFIRHLYEK